MADRAHGQERQSGTRWATLSWSLSSEWSLISSRLSHCTSDLGFGCKLFDLYLFEIRDKLEHNCSTRKKQRAAVALITSDIEKKIYETATAERKQELHELRNKWALADDALKETGVYEKALEQYLEEISMSHVRRTTRVCSSDKACSTPSKPWSEPLFRRTMPFLTFDS